MGTFLLATGLQTGNWAHPASYPMGTVGVKRPECEAGHITQSSDEVKNAWSYTSTLPTLLRGVVLN